MNFSMKVPPRSATQSAFGLLKRTSHHLLGGAIFIMALHASPSFAEEKTPPLPSLSNSLAGNYLAARIAATDQDTQSAVSFFRKAIALDPENLDLKLQGFLNFIANGDFNEGVKLGEEIAKNKNPPEVVSLILAVEDLRKKSWNSADRKLNKEWRSALDRLMTGLLSAWVKHGQNKPKEALATIDALQGPPWFDLFVQYHGGILALASGNTEEAIRRLQVGFDNRAGGQAANDTYVQLITALIHAHWKAGDTKAALNITKEGLRLIPQSPLFKYLAEEIKQNKPAHASIHTAQRGAAEVFLNLGTAINKEGGKHFSRIYLQLAHTLAEDDDMIITQLAELLDNQDQPQQANALFAKIKETSPYYRISRLEIALNQDQMGELEKAKTELDNLIQSGPDDLIAHLSYGAVLARHEKFDEAITVYQRISKRIEKPQQFHWNLFFRQGIAYERTKQWPLAEASFHKSLELLPNQPSVMNYLGYSWIDMNINLEEGLELIRKAVSLRPNDGYIVDSLGWAYYRLKRFDSAVVELEKAVELRPGDPTINDHLGDAYWKVGRKLEATFQWKHALSLNPEEKDKPRIENKLTTGLDVVEQKELAQKNEGKDDQQ